MYSNKTYANLSQSRRMRSEYPAGDPFGGAAFGEKRDWGTALTVGGGVVSGIMSSNAQADAANNASGAQVAASEASIKEQKRQFDQLQKLLSPYVAAGSTSLAAQGNLIGLGGNAAQQTAIDNLKQSSQFNELNRQGQDAILQNASATGGLRGGNTQAALAQFSPQLLNQLISQQYTNLGGITSLGQNSAALTGNAGMQSANAISNQYGQIGAAQAGNSLAQGNAQSQLWNSIGTGLGTLGSRF